MKKKRGKWIVLIILAVIIVLIVIASVVAGNAPMPVSTVKAVKGEIEQVITTSGTVQTDVTKNYFSDVSVKVGEIHVSAGDAVKKGDKLLTYDATDLQEKTKLTELKQQSVDGSYQGSVQSNNQKLGELKEATVNLDVLEQQIKDTEAYIDNLEKKIADKKSELELFGTKLQISLLDWKDQPNSDEYLNLQKLIQENNYEVNHNEEIEGWKAELEVYNEMLTGYKEYRAEMKSQKSSAQVGKMTSGAQAQLEADNQTKTIETTGDLEALQAAAAGVVAEFDGVVTEVGVVEGAGITEGTKLFVLESTEEVSVSVFVTKYDLDKIAIGQKATVTIGGHEYEGEVCKINKKAEKNAGGSSVVGTYIRLLNPDSEVYLGVEAKVVIRTAKETDTVLVPFNTVNVDVEGEFVYVIEDGILVRKPVETGISSDTMIQILSGVSEGDELVTEVTTGIEEGMAVMAIPEP